MFEPLPAKFDFPEAEKRVLEFWNEHDVFGKSLELRRGQPQFVFYEGPPTANGVPHPGHCLTRAMKDLFPRYKTMRGYLVERKAGWDTHGLPVEIEVCRELGINTKDEIERYGVAKFVERCIQSVFRYVREWEEMTDRLGFWINLDDAYVTYHQSYVESVWWGLKTLFERGLLYQGHKVVWWWAQGGTALSAGEVGEGYRTVEDPSVYIRFPIVREAEQASRANEEPRASARPDLRNENVTASEEPRGLKSAAPHEQLDPTKRVSLLVWTTTPWTLISNHFAAVHPDFEYALVHDRTTDEYFYLATALVDTTAEKVKHEFEVVSTCWGADLLGLRYVPPFDCYSSQLVHEWGGFRLDPPKTMADLEFPLASRVERMDSDTFEEILRKQYRVGTTEYRAVGWRVVPADFVTLDTGTGIVHQAPAYGEVDFNLWKEESRNLLLGLRLLNAVAPDGTFTDEAPERYRGRWVKDCDEEIMQELAERGILLHKELIEHEYPFCPRAEDDPLIQYARKSWFVHTSEFKEEFLKNNDAIYWLPEHIKEGRFGDFLRNNVDWALSRERYWGTPLPIWVCEKTGKMESIGSYAELLSKPGVQGTELWENAKRENPDLPEHLKVHKPYIDAITYDSPFVGEHGPPARMRRVPEVIDCWWDAGSMPFAQWGFPHVEGSVQTFAERFPCDFISEAIDQTRGWFYGLLAISTLLFKGSMGLRPVSGGMGLRPVSGGMGLRPVSGGTGPRPVSGGMGLRPGSGGTGPRPVTPPQPSLPTTSDLLKRRRLLPHWEAGGCTYLVTFRLYQGELSPDERTFVLEACRHWDGQRMLLHAVAVMPDHVHMLLTPLESAPGVWWSVADLMHSIKGYTATQLNKRRGQTGPFWQQEYYDRIIRDQSDFDEKWSYIVTNPERRGLPEDYPWVWVEPSHAGEQGNGPEAHGNYGPEAHAPHDVPGVSGGSEAHRDYGPEAHAHQIEYPMPYKTCIVLGHVMGEDGLKMSKRTGNYKEPDYIFDHYGADAMRWYFFSAQTPWTSIRFMEAAIRDAQREFLLRLYNVFSFFNIYANIDGFEPGLSDQATKRGSDEEEPRASARSVQRNESAAALGEPGGLKSGALSSTGWRPVSERSQIDRWITGELHGTVGFVRDGLDRFENFPAAGRLNEFVDALSNWYVRRSRERFWRPLSGGVGVSPADQDKWDAYNTLYEVLVALSKLIAPFTPFIAETMYQNLVRVPGPGGSRGAVPLSVHLCDYPEPDEALIDEKLAEEMDLVRQIASLGRAARTAAKLKVRQPLARVEIILAHHEQKELLTAHDALIAEELNVKSVEFSSEAERYVRYRVVPNFKTLGPRFGTLAPKIAQALANIEHPAAARKTLLVTGELSLQVDGEPIILTKEEVGIRLEAKEGWSAAQGRAGVVVVSTELTPALRKEGLVRELIHHVQGLRKDQNLAYEARITLHVQGPEEFLDIVRRFTDTIAGECLAERIEFSVPPRREAKVAKIDGHAVQLAVVAE